MLSKPTHLRGTRTSTARHDSASCHSLYRHERGKPVQKLKILPEHNEELLFEAMRSHNPYYLERLFKESREDSEKEMLLGWTKEEFPRSHIMNEMEKTTTSLPMNLDNYIVTDEQGDRLYNGLGADLSGLDLFVCAPEEMRILGPRGYGGCSDLGQMYREACNPQAKIEREAREKCQREHRNDPW